VGRGHARRLIVDKGLKDQGDKESSTTQGTLLKTGSLKILLKLFWGHCPAQGAPGNGLAESLRWIFMQSNYIL
jgi:hypothetical protein